MVAQRYDLRLETRETRVQTLPWGLGKQRSRDHPIDAPATPTEPTRTLPDADLSLPRSSRLAQKDKRRMRLPLCRPRSFDRAVMGRGAGPVARAGRQ